MMTAAMPKFKLRALGCGNVAAYTRCNITKHESQFRPSSALAAPQKPVSYQSLPLGPVQQRLRNFSPPAPRGLESDRATSLPSVAVRNGSVLRPVFLKREPPLGTEATIHDLDCESGRQVRGSRLGSVRLSLLVDRSP